MFIIFYFQTFQYFRYYLSGKDMTQQNYDGRTALHVAAAQGKGNLLRLKGLAIHIVCGYHSQGCHGYCLHSHAASFRHFPHTHQY